MEEAGPQRKPWRPFTREPGHTPTHAQAGFPCHLPKRHGQLARHARAMSWSAPQPLNAIPSEGKLRPCYPGMNDLPLNCWGPQTPDVRHIVKSTLPEEKDLHRKHGNKRLHHSMSHSFASFHFFTSHVLFKGWTNFPAPPRCPHRLE